MVNRLIGKAYGVNPSDIHLAFSLSFTYVVVTTTTVVGESVNRVASMTEKISDAEHAVMEALWDASPLTAADVAERVRDARGWSIQTVKTLLSRLLAKDIVAAEQDGRRFLYRPLVQRDDYVTGESRRLVDRLFGGRAAPLVAHLAEQDQLSSQDIAELEALLKALKS